MPKVFTVTQAFLSTDKETKEPQLVPTKGGPMHKYMVQFENQSIPGWVSILRKPDSPAVVEGDQFYGVLEENDWGKPQFTRMQTPQDGSVQLNQGGTKAPAAQSAGTVPQSNGSRGALPVASTKAQSSRDEELHEKVDFLISLVEQLAESQGIAVRAVTANGDSDPSDDDTAPLDLSEIPY
jgi:hypothetical protein